jgi:hypothetical protein
MEACELDQRDYLHEAECIARDMRGPLGLPIIATEDHVKAVYDLNIILKNKIAMLEAALADNEQTKKEAAVFLGVEK